MNTCAKCEKQYSTTKHYLLHAKECNGIDKLTCPRCMHTFSSSGNKCKHIKINNCKPLSILTYAQEHGKDIELYINDYGKERIDYIDEKYIVGMVLRMGYDAILSYIGKKYFNEYFPENHTIKKTDKNYMIRKNGNWQNIDKHNLLKDLFARNGHELAKIMHQENNPSTHDNVNTVYLEVNKKDKNIKLSIDDLIINHSLFQTAKN